MSEPLVTVGLPVYNGERFVSKSIDTLLAQTFHDFRIVICDNASSDRTGEICKEYASRDRRIEYHRNATNIGMAGNYNLTFSKCRSKYFRWATGDDFIAPEMLEDHVRVMEGNPEIAVCYSQAWFVNEAGEPYEAWTDELHLMQDDPVKRFKAVVTKISRVHHHLGLMRSDCLRRTGGFRSHVSADLGLIAELSLLGKIYRIEKKQFFRRMHEASSSFRTHDDEHQARYYHAANVSRLAFGRLRFHAYYVSVVHRSALSLAQKLEAYAFLLATPSRDRGWLGLELRNELRRVLKSATSA